MSGSEASLPRQMKTTTVRLGGDLWALLDVEAARAGVSVSQYMREAALARAAFAVGARGGTPPELLCAWAGTLFDGERVSVDHAANTDRLLAELKRSRYREQREEAAAVRAESRQAQRQAHLVRQRAAAPTEP